MCPVCRSPLGAPIYCSSGPLSITSLCELRQEQALVHFCPRCGHTSTPPLPDLRAYYDASYRILVDSEEEDQLYALVKGVPVYRTEHQAATLLRKAELARNARVLDYGAGKASTLSALVKIRPDIAAHVFDVSETYLPFWRRFLTEDRYATYQPQPGWRDSFDVVTSFFALEHAADPTAFLGSVRDLLRPGGVVYGIVPNLFTNTADLVVVDHVNHFSRESLSYLLTAAGFDVLDVDGEAHNGAWVFLGRKTGTAPRSLPPAPDPALGSRLREMAAYWSGFAEGVRAFESGRAGGRPAAVYGSGFYGTFLSTCLQHPERVECFVDRNPHRQKQRLLDKAILDPAALPPSIEVVYVALNPRHARSAIQDLTCWNGRNLEFYYP